MRALLLALALAACSSPTLAPRDCTPGTTSACVCAAAQASGVQVCTPEGTLGVCVCSDAGMMQADAGVLPDAPPATDRPELADAVTARDAGLEDAALTMGDVPLATDRLEPDAAPPTADVPRDASGCDDASVCGGRCVDLQSDPTNCGACETRCTTTRPHMQALCFAARCATRCAEGWRNCDGNDANGCETDEQNDRTNCGGCGITCPAGNVCVVAACRLR